MAKNGSKKRFFEAKTPTKRQEIRVLSENGKISVCRIGLKT